MPEPLERHFANLDRLVALERDLAEARRERDEARAQIGDVRASISAHKIRVATDERDAAIDRAETAEHERDKARAERAAAEAAENRVKAERDEARRQRDHSMATIDAAIDAAQDSDGARGLVESVRHLREGRDERTRHVREWQSVADGYRRERDKARAEVERLRRELKEATAQCDSVLRQCGAANGVEPGAAMRHVLADRDALAKERAEARAEVERLGDVLRCMRVNHDAACERAGWRELGGVAVLLGYARGAAEDFGEVDVVGVREAVSRLRTTSWPAERRDIAIREAEERGARWALDERHYQGDRAEKAARICHEARERGEHG